MLPCHQVLVDQLRAEADFVDKLRVEAAIRVEAVNIEPASNTNGID